MTADDPLVSIGRVGRAHGLDGSFVVDRASDDERRWEIGASVIVDGVPTRIVASRRVGGGKRAVKLDRPAARGSDLAVRRSELPTVEEGTYYVFQLVGLRVQLPDGSGLGVVREVHDGVANANLELDDGRLIPLIEDAIVSVDLDAGTVIVAPAFTGQ